MMWRMLPYDRIMAGAGVASVDGLIRFLRDELPYVWREAYLAMTPRPSELMRFQQGSFEYLFDDYTLLEASGAVPYDPVAEGRLIAALGLSAPRPRARDDNRLRGWVGRTERTFGKAWDKGHYIAHTIGGAVDGLEANVFLQRRDLNRGWSAQGKLFRRMETYCVQHPGTFCFARPLYTDLTAKPAQLEFGVLKTDGVLWVEYFDNR